MTYAQKICDALNSARPRMTERAWTLVEESDLEAVVQLFGKDFESGNDLAAAADDLAAELGVE